MAAPLQTGKKSVNLSAPGVRVSRIRRDPPPKVKEVTEQDLRDRDSRTVVIGILTFAVAIVIAIIGFGSFGGWSPKQYTIEIRD